MANKTTSPLKSAMGGDIEKLNDKQTKNALTDAVDRLGKVKRLAESSKEQVVRTGTALMHSAETMGSLFLSSMAEGFVGPEKIQLGGVDVRAPSGMLMQGYGLYQILSGSEGGEHFLSIGNGVTGSWLASVGQDAGRALRERKNGGSPPPAPAPAPTTFRGEESMVYIPPLDAGSGQNFGGPVYGGAAQYALPPGGAQAYGAQPSGIAGFLPPPAPAQPVPAQYGQAPYGQAPYAPAQPAPAQYGWQTSGPQYSNLQHPVTQYPAPQYPAPQLSGPVREILPLEAVPGFDPSAHGRPYPHAPAVAGQTGAYHYAPPAYPGAPTGGHPPPSPAPAGQAAPEREPFLRMQLTPEVGCEPAQPTMRFTPEAPERGQVRTEPTRDPYVKKPDFGPRDDVAGPRERFRERQGMRQELNNRFPRARRAEAEEGTD